jgi:hypothetical protein
MSIEKACGDVVVTVPEDGCSDFDLIAEDSLGGVATVVDNRLDLLDDDSLAAFTWFHARYNSFDGFRDIFAPVLRRNFFASSRYCLFVFHRWYSMWGEGTTQREGYASNVTAALRYSADEFTILPYV